MIQAIQNIVRHTDAAIARMYLSLFRERSAVLTFLFHSLFRDQSEIAQDLVDPLQRTTLDQFRSLIEYYIAAGYSFISVDDLLRGAINPDGRYVVLTFDDGYYNNRLALPILEQYAVPAMFFISTDHVLQQKCYWWDVMYRELVARGATRKQAYEAAAGMKHLRTEEIERQLAEKYGPDAFRPRGEIDRPFTADELREFARSPLVHLGNHTAGHAILTNYTPDEQRDQIARGQRALQEITGQTPSVIAYPNGGFDELVVKICREIGLRAAFTVRPQKCTLPLPHKGDAGNWFRLGRFCPHGGAPMLTQCRTCRSDVSLYGTARALYVKMFRGVSA
jgi:peptidoglycan/xylan/chitin deacetylase (PgdA/CDA1 family)